MNGLTLNHTRQGSIIVVTLILLLAMTTMGVGLYYSTKHTAKQVAVSGNRTEALYSSESCIVEAVDWLEIEAAKGKPPCKSSGNSVCKTITANMSNSKWRLGGESFKQQNRAGAQAYACSVSLLGTVSSSSNTGTGFDVGQSDGYGGNSTSTKYLYKVTSETHGANGVVSQVEVIVSTIF
jgi:Tfp pilus assembly protein PilX